MFRSNSIIEVAFGVYLGVQLSINPAKVRTGPGDDLKLQISDFDENKSKVTVLG